MSRTVRGELTSLAGLATAIPQLQTHSEVTLLGSDLDVGRRFADQVDDDADSLQETRDAARDVAALVRPTIDLELARADAARGRRSQQFDLLQAAFIGAAVMTFTAVHSFQYRLPVPDLVQPALISLLGAMTLWLAVAGVALTLSDGPGSGPALDPSATGNDGAVRVTRGPVDRLLGMASGLAVQRWRGRSLRAAMPSATGRRPWPSPA